MDRREHPGPEPVPQRVPQEGGTSARPLHARVPGAVERARAYIMKMKPSIQGQKGSATLISACRATIDEFGITGHADIRSVLDPWNASRCEPPWSEKELEQAIANTLARYPNPSCSKLNEDRRSKGDAQHMPAYGEAPIAFDYSDHGPSANGDGHASQAAGGPAAGNGQKVEPWPVGATVQAHDRDNFGTILVDDGGEWLQIHFESKAGHTARVRLRRSQLTLLSGQSSQSAGSDAEPFDLGLMDSAAFDAGDFRREFIVENVLVDRQPCVVGGPRKAVKTSLMVALAIAIAAGAWFLGRFRVIRPRRVLFLSGESGEGTIQETARRIAVRMGVDIAGLGGNLAWGFRLPSLSNPAQLKTLAEAIREHQAEVVVVDPLYLCLLSGGDLNAANLFDMGPLLRAVATTCLDAGATPILVHHLRKDRDDPLGPPDLEDLAFAGIQEFARQWLLIGRRSAHVPGTGRHELWLHYGGSAGHGGAWALDVEEGVADENLQGRYWSIELNPAGEVRQAALVERELAKQKAKDEASRAKADTDASAVANHVRKHGPRTQPAIRHELHWGQERALRAIQQAKTSAWIDEVEVEVKRGRTTSTETAYQATFDKVSESCGPCGPCDPDRTSPDATCGLSGTQLGGSGPDRTPGPHPDPTTAQPGEPVVEDPGLDAGGFPVDPPF